MKKLHTQVNYKEDNFGIKIKEIATTYDLNLIKEDYSKLLYKDKFSEGGSSASKYFYLRHLSKSNRLHFSHKKAELKLMADEQSTRYWFLEETRNKFATLNEGNIGVYADDVAIHPDNLI